MLDRYRYRRGREDGASQGRLTVCKCHRAGGVGSLYTIRTPDTHGPILHGTCVSETVSQRAGWVIGCSSRRPNVPLRASREVRKLLLRIRRRRSKYSHFSFPAEGVEMMLDLSPCRNSQCEFRRAGRTPLPKTYVCNACY